MDTSTPAAPEPSRAPAPAAPLPRAHVAPHHPWDRAYHLLWLIIAWAALIAGFGPGSYAHMTGARPPDPPIVDLHAAVFSFWMVLVTVQIGLVRFKRLRTHITLGTLGIILAIAVVVFGIAVATTMSRRAYDKDHNPFTLQFYFHELMDMAVFGAFFLAAMLQRRTPAAHKRLMILATTFLLGAGFARFIGPLTAPLQQSLPAPWQFIHYFLTAYSGITFLMALAAAHDLITRRRLHPANAWGIPIILTCQALVMYVVYAVPGWAVIARRLLGVN